MLHFVRKNKSAADERVDQRERRKMTQQAKSTSSKTRTLKIDGQLYQRRLVTCGKEKCSRCEKGGGHAAVYLDTGGKGGQRWQYVGAKLPDADPSYEQPTCQREECDNPVSRRNQKYCSAKCRVDAHRETT